jgi:hypothetical protein
VVVVDPDVVVVASPTVITIVVFFARCDPPGGS